MKNKLTTRLVHIMLICIATALIGCSDDDGNAPINDPILGTWTYYKLFENDVEIPLDDCEDLETFVFTNNGVVEYEYYEEDITDTCVLEEDITGTWENMGNDTYTLTFGNESVTEQLSFEGDTFTVTDTYVDGGETITDRYVYIKS